MNSFGDRHDESYQAATVAMVTMPFGPHLHPSTSLSLLQTGLREQGINSRIHYFTLRFAELIGVELYDGIVADSSAAPNKITFHELVGEWLFRDALFSDGNVDGYVDEILRRRSAWPEHAAKKPVLESLIRRVVKVREKIPPFLSQCAEEIVASRPGVVGFTSTFQQHIAALALSKRLKELVPELPIVFGGANVEGVMGAETLRQFPFVDAVVSGEGDFVFPEVVRRLLHGRPLDGIEGVRTRGSVEREFRSGAFPNVPMVLDMDRLPIPDYDDYFEQFEGSALSKQVIPALFFESSRGCWWGERMHCTFCGLNGSGMRYRSKSAPRALEELRTLTSRYPGCSIQVSDNILDMKYLDDLMPALAEAKLDTEIFYEVKANLKKHHVRGLHAAGVVVIQPGIESLSDGVLKLMRKGVSALQNIQLLKWCKEIGVRPLWGCLWGFPGEDPAAYEEMADLVPKLRHLPPPQYMCAIRLDRFSPNFFDFAALGFANLRPLAPYRHIYPFTTDVLSNLAYFFNFDYEKSTDVARYVRPLRKALQSWQNADRAEDVLSIDDGRCIAIWDLRRGASGSPTTLTGLDRFLYLQCDAVSDVRALAVDARAAGFDYATEVIVAERLAPLITCDLLLQDGNRYLALAIPVGEYQPSREVLGRIRSAAQSVRRRADRVRPAVAAPAEVQ